MLTRVNGATPTSEGEAHPGPTRPAPTALPGGRALLQLPALPALRSTLRTPSLRIQPSKVQRAARCAAPPTGGHRSSESRARHGESPEGANERSQLPGRNAVRPCTPAACKPSIDRPWLRRGPTADRCAFRAYKDSGLRAPPELRARQPTCRRRPLSTPVPPPPRRLCRARPPLQGGGSTRTRARAPLHRRARGSPGATVGEPVPA